MRVVLDTNAIVSGFLYPRGTVGQALRALREGRFHLIYSTEIMLEVVAVLQRPAIRQKYRLASEDIEALVYFLRLRGELAIPRRRLRVCRDPKDDKFLEAALAAQADAIVTGDADLLTLHPFGGVEILSPRAFLERLQAQSGA